jgi:hypothetical protein
MTRDEFENNRDALLNESWCAWIKLPKKYQTLLLSIDFTHIEMVHPATGIWIEKSNYGFYPCFIYRIDPNWDGPIKEIYSQEKVL